jgi:hypothetical protein
VDSRDELIKEVIARVIAGLVQENKIAKDQIGPMSEQIYLSLHSSDQNSTGEKDSRASHRQSESRVDYSASVQAAHGMDPKEVVIGVGAAFQTGIKKTITGLDLGEVIKTIRAGIEEEGMSARVVKILDTSDVCFMGLEAAKLSGSGIGIGIQSKGTAVIHQKDLYPLSNLELFSQAPLITMEIYRHIGKNAAKYVKGERVTPVTVVNDPMVRPSYQVKAALMHIRETEALDEHIRCIEWN